MAFRIVRRRSLGTPDPKATTNMRTLLAAQGVFYFVTGLWPIIHMPSFVAVTGDKTDLWLVRTVGALLAVSGVAFWRERLAPNPRGNLALLAAMQATVLALVDVIYVARGVISLIYLADAVVEALLLIAWIKLSLPNAATR